MLKPEQVPDEAVAAFQKAWADPSTLSTKECLAAAINAWPGMICYPPDLLDEVVNPERVILPLPQKEKSE